MKKWTRLMYALLMVLIITACLLPAQKALADGPQAEGNIISNVVIKGSLTPEVGSSAQLDDLECLTQGVTFLAGWAESNVFRNGGFRAGFSYTLTVKLFLEKGYEWDNAIDWIEVAGIKSDSFTKSDKAGTAKFRFNMGGEKTFFVNFNSMGHGTAPAELEVKAGESIQDAIKRDTTRDLPWIYYPTEEWEMTGWYKDYDLTTAFALTEKVNSDLTLFAKWIKPSWTVSFDAGEGGSGNMGTVLVEKNKEYKLPNCTFKAPAGMEFDKWDKGAAGTSIKITANTTLTALWRKMPVISFDRNGGGGKMDSVKVATGTKYKLPACDFIAPAGKEFDKWDKGAAGTSITITADTTLIAQWKKMPVISFDRNGGTGNMESLRVPTGTKYIPPNCGFKAPAEKEFDKWLYNGDPLPAGKEITITDDTTLTATWKECDPVISFDRNGGTGKMDSVKVTKGTEYTLPECGFGPNNSEWIFDKWLIDNKKEGAVGDKITITADTTLTAQWKKLPVIYFVPNDGTGTMESVVVPEGTEYTLPECGFKAPAGKEFDKWNLGEAGEIIIIDQDTILKPLWKDSSNGETGTIITMDTGSQKGQQFLVIGNGQVSFSRTSNQSTVTIPPTIENNGRTYKVTSVEKNAFSGTKARTVIIGKNVKKLKKGAFSNSKVKKIILKTKLLKKKTVKGSLKNSKVKTVQVKVGAKKSNKKCVKKYKKIFKKKNSGKKVKVKR